MNKSILGLAIVIVAIIGGVAISLKSQHLPSTQHQSTVAVASVPQLLAARAEPKAISSERTKLQGVNLQSDHLTIQTENIDEQIEISSREIKDIQSWIVSNHIKEQLNSPDLSKSTREVYFDNLNRLAKLQLGIVRLRVEKIKRLESSMKEQAS